MCLRHEGCGGKLAFYYQDLEWVCESCGLAPEPQPARPQPSDYSTPVQIDLEEQIDKPEPLLGSTADYLGET